MKVRKLEKRADGVIRWLERMKSAYSSGAVESAYMDAECARADLEDLRSEFLRPKERGRFLLMFSRVMFLAMMIVMIAVMPLSRERVVVAPPEPEVVMLYPPEPEVKPEPQPKKSRAKTSAVKRPVQPATTAPVKSAQKPKVSAQTKTVAYDKVYSLVQTGQRALKNDKSVIIK
ncbi:MAG: hypothetical protein IJG51_00585 [Synergistaceae bacterium]|nr:hypothetical protein [Synergistaceae bacterium]MBQ3347277.1 hypothetical protein [Synergistaceae bacterium]MBQ3397365.1 hypothetical protein [Synergistaceae bacterium]MBQ4400692.1 hypothetical protein [Synergistaceae bacterium]MBQ6114408.1 hypothetical protein [Synergistaceae bacterium]